MRDKKYILSLHPTIPGSSMYAIFFFYAVALKAIDFSSCEYDYLAGGLQSTRKSRVAGKSRASFKSTDAGCFFH